jgi:hypothetical protein
MNSQGSGASNVKILQSQNRQHAKIRLSFNGLPVVHGRLDDPQIGQPVGSAAAGVVGSHKTLGLALCGA